MLEHITPVLLTYNEELNIERTLSRLTWAKDIVLVDSGSTDRTVELARALPQVRIFERPFDTHGNQWRYAVEETGIQTEWLLRLDADYQVTEELVEEMSKLALGAPADAYRVRFDYAIFGKLLISSLYPSNIVLLRVGRAAVFDRGHTEKWTVSGPVIELKEKIIHDDWKSTDAWIGSQIKYMKKEMQFTAYDKTKMTDWLRRHPPLMPILIFFYCLFGRGLILNGRAGLYYTLQRTIAETVLSLLILEKHLRAKT